MAATAERKVEVFDTEEVLAVSLAKYVADLSDKFCKEKGAFTIVLSGGSLIESLR
jgi:6-phosphogluconolactonase